MKLALPRSNSNLNPAADPVAALAEPPGAPSPVPPRIIDAALTAGAAAFRGQAFRPWRFLVVRDRDRLAALRRLLAADGHRPAARAAIAIFTPLNAWKRSAAALLPGWGRDPRLIAHLMRSVPQSVSLAQQLRQLCTYMSLATGALGWAAEPAVELPAPALRRELGLRPGMEVVGLLLIAGPRRPGRSNPDRWRPAIAFEERLNQPWGHGAFAAGGAGR